MAPRRTQLPISRSVDQLVVINGPLDGADYPIVRYATQIGGNGMCDIVVQHDAKAENTIARTVPVRRGYRIRRTGKGRVLVEGKGVGKWRSRTLRQRGVLQIGQTMLVLKLGEGGLSARRMGSLLETDPAWIGRRAFAVCRAGWQQALRWRTGRKWARRIRDNWLWVSVTVCVALYFFHPPFRQWVNWAGATVRQFIQSIL